MDGRATNGARRLLRGHAPDLARRPFALSILLITLAVLQDSWWFVLLVLLQDEFFKRAATPTCTFLLLKDWLGIPMPRCSVNGACNLVRVRAIRFPPLRHWPRCGCSAQALAGFITAAVTPSSTLCRGPRASRRHLADHGACQRDRMPLLGCPRMSRRHENDWGEAPFLCSVCPDGLVRTGSGIAWPVGS